MIYIAFLRGINVGGKKKVKMADLKNLVESGGYENVKTYIQSGNLVFSTEKPGDHGSQIEKWIKEQFFYDVPVFCYTLEELKSCSDTFPFGKDHPDKTGNRTVMTFFNTEPENIDIVKKFVSSGEKLVYSGKAVWLYCPDGYGKTKLSNTFLEKKLGVRATTRNLKTIKMMIHMAEEITGNG